MKRPRLSREAFVGLAGACTLLAAGCRPDNDVAPGAPVLIEYIIVQATPGFPTATKILPDTTDCPGSAVAGGVCDPATDVFCRLATSNDWCSCAGTDPMDPAVGAWACPSFSAVGAVIAVFDRLLDTAPLGPGNAGPAPIDIATATSPAGATTLATDYGSNGAVPGAIFPFFGENLFGNFRQNGPSLFSAPQPAFPSGTTVTVTLDKTKVVAKDGSTAFTGVGLLQDGVLMFNTAAFGVTLLDPDPTTADPAGIPAQFNNFVDSAAVAANTTVTANGTAVPFDIKQPNDGANLLIIPLAPATAWPAGATIVITIAAATPSLAGETLGTPATHMFTAP